MAQALDIPMVELLPLASGRSADFGRMVDILTRLPPSQLSDIADLIERRVNGATAEDRARRIALVGLRGAGKSTLGRMLAEKFGIRFIELDRIIEQEYGASLSMLIEMSGLAGFRRHERASLEHVIAQHDAAVIATAGGNVSDAETYGLLLRRTHTVWINARPEDHMSRVMKQGDFRPMAKNREAMSDLLAILDARHKDYARAEATLNTSGATPEQSLAKLSKIVIPWLTG
jgi:XRE family aerobic/anaerobic benzoate catabolism transcriptional regulator